MQEKPFAAFDIDGTIFRWQLFHEVVFELIELGGLPTSIADKVAEPLANWKSRANAESYKTYEHALFYAMADNLKGIPAELFDKAAARVIERSAEHVYAYTRDLAKQLKEQGYTLLAVSGSFEEAVALFAKKYGFDDWAGAQLERKDGALTGQGVWGHDRKGEALKQLVAKHNLSWKGSIAIGDSLSDGDMMELVEQPIAFNPNQQLYDLALAKKWKIVVERKNVVYHLTPDEQGRYELS